MLTTSGHILLADTPVCCAVLCPVLCCADVANLVLDGADGIVLGSETFRGKFPVQSVETVLAIARQAEKCFDSFAYYNSVMDYAGYHSLNPDISKVRAPQPHTGLLVGLGLAGQQAAGSTLPVALLQAVGLACPTSFMPIPTSTLAACRLFCGCRCYCRLRRWPQQQCVPPPSCTLP